jgi:hypothetical protein
MCSFVACNNNGREFPHTHRPKHTFSIPLACSYILAAQSQTAASGQHGQTLWMHGASRVAQWSKALRVQGCPCAIVH